MWAWPLFGDLSETLPSPAPPPATSPHFPEVARPGGRKAGGAGGGGERRAETSYSLAAVLEAPAVWRR